MRVSQKNAHVFEVLQMSRIVEHPILEKLPERKRVLISVDGRTIEAFEGEPIVAALIAAGIHICRITKKRNEPRGLFCAIGRCTDCMMTVNGVPNVRTCITPVEENMKIETQFGLGQWREIS